MESEGKYRKKTKNRCMSVVFHKNRLRGKEMREVEREE